MNRFIIAALLIAIPASAQNLETVTRIRQEGFRNSKVMEYASVLVDEIGPRLTGSPTLKKANEWTRDELARIGLDAHLESYKFGRGWVSDATSVRVLSPFSEEVYAFAKAWSPATSGPVRGKVVKVKLETKDDLEKNKGKLAGAIVMTAEPKELKNGDTATLERYDEKELDELAQYAIPSAASEQRRRDYERRREFRKLLAQFAMDEKIAVIVEPGAGDLGAGNFRVQSSGTWTDEEPVGVPTVGIAPEHYNRIARLLDKKKDVEMEIDIRSRFLTDDLNSYNTIADLKGTDKKGEVVMMGAHLDSWHTSNGATDNAAGVVVIMEAARILKSLGVAPKRTIRVAFWSGEEQGLLGSRAYVEQHFAKREAPKDPEQAKLPLWARKDKGQLVPKPDYPKLSAYFNLDNGTGKVRGIYAQENAAVVPLFTAWLAPLHDLGATTVTMRNTMSTDHIAFDEMGLPGFQFIQDDVEYETRTHHTNWDTYERLQREDLMQAAVVVASVVWEAANREERMPRKP